jgi:hypothetical protein
LKVRMANVCERLWASLEMALHIRTLCVKIIPPNSAQLTQSIQCVIIHTYKETL